jgi:hypothetical protein
MSQEKTGKEMRGQKWNVRSLETAQEGLGSVEEGRLGKG